MGPHKEITNNIKLCPPIIIVSPKNRVSFILSITNYVNAGQVRDSIVTIRAGMEWNRCPIVTPILKVL